MLKYISVREGHCSLVVDGQGGRGGGEDETNVGLCGGRGKLHVKSNLSCSYEGEGFLRYVIGGRKVVRQYVGVGLPLVKGYARGVHRIVKGLIAVVEIVELEGVEPRTVLLVIDRTKVVYGSVVQFEIAVVQIFRFLVFLEGLFKVSVQSVLLEKHDEGFGGKAGRTEEVVAVKGLDALGDVEVLYVGMVELVDGRFSFEKKKNIITFLTIRFFFF